MRVLGQVHVKNKIVCAWCGGPARPVQTKPAILRAYYRCEANCTPNDPRGTQTLFAVTMQTGPGAPR